MNILILVKTSPTGKVVHSLIQALVVSFQKKDHRIQGIFFTDRAACIGSSNFDGLPEIISIRQAYIELGRKYDMPLMVCGRAFREQGLKVDQLSPGFCISGNAELAAMIAKCDRLAEF